MRRSQTPNRLPSHKADASWIVEKVFQNIPKLKIEKMLDIKKS